MKITKISLMLIMPFLLMACHSLETEGVQSDRRNSEKVRHVETENIQWDNASEESQELSDEI